MITRQKYVPYHGCEWALLVAMGWTTWNVAEPNVDGVRIAFMVR